MSTRKKLQEKLYAAIQAGDATAVGGYLSRGASANFTCSTGKTCLGIAAYLGNTQILKILLDSIYSDNNQQDKWNSEQHYSNRGLHNYSYVMAPYQVDSENCSSMVEPNCFEAYPFYDDQNRGYYVFINDDLTPVDLSPEYPSGMDALEWDEEVGIGANPTVEDEKWSELYKWYAQMLEQTEGLLGTENENVVPHESIRNGEMQDMYQRTAAHYAAEQGHSAVLRLLSQAGCRMDTNDIDGFTPLHLAVKSGHRASVRVLLSAGADVNKLTLNSQQFTPLHLATAYGHHDIVEILLSCHGSVETRDDEERTALSIAVKNEDRVIVNTLLYAKANPNVEDMKGSTPLCEAVWKNNVEIVDILIRFGARSPPHHHLLHYALLNRQVEITKLLLSQTRICVDLRDDNGDTPLLLAARSGQPELVKLLLKNGASVDYPNSLTGSTALHEAVECVADFPVFEDIFICLQEYNVNLDATSLTGGGTPLFRAILLQRDNAAKLLIKHGADVNICSLPYFDMDNLTLALRAQNTSLANLLVLAGAPPPPSWGNNPRPLSHIVRLVLRSCLRPGPLFTSISSLPLPTSLKGFLMFEDED